MNDLLRIFTRLFSAGTYTFKDPIDISSVAYNPGKSFYLSVGTGGMVVYKDRSSNDTKTAYFGAGYHPVELTYIGTAGNGTTATDLTANR